MEKHSIEVFIGLDNCSVDLSHRVTKGIVSYEKESINLSTVEAQKLIMDLAEALSGLDDPHCGRATNP